MYSRVVTYFSWYLCVADNTNTLSLIERAYRWWRMTWGGLGSNVGSSYRGREGRVHRNKKTY